MSDEILTIKEVAHYLKVAEKTIYRLAGAKKLPGFKVGGIWRFRKNQVDHWIDIQSIGIRKFTKGSDNDS